MSVSDVENSCSRSVYSSIVMAFNFKTKLLSLNNTYNMCFIGCLRLLAIILLFQIQMIISYFFQEFKPFRYFLTILNN